MKVTFTEKKKKRSSTIQDLQIKNESSVSTRMTTWTPNILWVFLKLKVNAYQTLIKSKVSPTCHSDWAALWPKAAWRRRWRPHRRGSSTMTGQRGAAGGGAAGRPRWSQCHPAACWRSVRADSFLKETGWISFFSSFHLFVYFKPHSVFASVHHKNCFFFLIFQQYLRSKSSFYVLSLFSA